MKKSPYPSTSREAFASLKHSEVQEMYRRIAEALGVIQEGTSEQIAAHLKVDADRVWKRLDEMRKAGTIYRPGTKRPLKSGREGFTWRLTTPNSKEERLVENKKLEGLSVSDYSRNILHQGKLL